MVNYDSDSSDGENNDFTETNVLLGYASSDANGEDISRLGGRPDWLDPSKPPSAALARCKVCKDLMVLLLQLNAELPDRFPGHERRLYVFTCRRKSCRRKEGSMRAIRGVRVSEDAATAAAAITAQQNVAKKENTPATNVPSAATLGLGEALFGVKPGAGAGGAGKSANPFATGSSSTNPFAPNSSTGTAASSNPFAPKPTSPPPPAVAETKTEEDKSPETKQTTSLPETFAQKLSLNNPQTTVSLGPTPPPEPWPAEDSPDQPAPYPVRWLSDVEYEALDPNPSVVPQQTSMMDIDSSEGSGSGGGGKEDKEVFESTMDSVFQKFADRVGQNPEQCIRYEFAGQPLLYSKNDIVGRLLHTGSADDNQKVSTTAGKGKGIPRCNNCGAGRVFEVQLTPHAIEELEIDEDGLDGMDWGTVVVGVCERDCQERGANKGEGAYVEEWCGVQWEELSVKR